jgi:hypothetical protein
LSQTTLATSLEVPRGLLVSGGDRAKLPNLGEEVPDQMERRVQLAVIVGRRAPTGSQRDYRGLAGGHKRLKNVRVDVECLIGDQRTGLHRRQQLVIPDRVVRLTAGQEQVGRVAQLADQSVYLGAPSAAFDLTADPQVHLSHVTKPPVAPRGWQSGAGFKSLQASVVNSDRGDSENPRQDFGRYDQEWRATAVTMVLGQGHFDRGSNRTF